MGNDWTRLVQKAAELGGPHHLKSHYTNGGRAQGLIVAGLVGVAWGAKEVYTLVSKSNADRNATKTGQGQAPETEPGPDVSGGPDRR